MNRKFLIFNDFAYEFKYVSDGRFVLDTSECDCTKDIYLTFIDKKRLYFQDLDLSDIRIPFNWFDDKFIKDYQYVYDNYVEAL